jgi:hypothetical protein
VLVNSLERLAALEEVQQITPHHSAFGDGV